MKKILLVEDDQIQQKILERVMKSLGFEVATAASSEEALKFLRGSSPALLIVDFYLPDINGIEFIKQANEEKLLQNSKILLMSIDNNEELPVLGISNGADAFITKPIRINELVLKLNSLLELHLDPNNYSRLKEKIQQDMSPRETPVTYENMTFLMNDPGPGGSSTFASVLVLQMPEINRLARGLKPVQLSEFLSQFYIEVGRIVYHSRGSVHHILGGSMLATFGAPLVYDNDTLNALLCAQRIRDYLQKFNQNLPAYVSQPLRITMGLASGRLDSCNVFAVRRTSSTVIGEPVDRANALAYLAAVSNQEIMADDETRQVIENYAQLETINAKESGQLCKLLNVELAYAVRSINVEKIVSLPNLENQPGATFAVDEEEYDKL